MIGCRGVGGLREMSRRQTASMGNVRGQKGRVSDAMMEFRVSTDYDNNIIIIRQMRLTQSPKLLMFNVQQCISLINLTV